MEEKPELSNTLSDIRKKSQHNSSLEQAFHSSAKHRHLIVPKEAAHAGRQGQTWCCGQTLPQCLAFTLPWEDARKKAAYESKALGPVSVPRQSGRGGGVWLGKPDDALDAERSRQTPWELPLESDVQTLRWAGAAATGGKAFDCRKTMWVEEPRRMSSLARERDLDLKLASWTRDGRRSSRKQQVVAS